ncbi:alkaline phosphatase D family protein [Henriciella sp. AS95]|uniref:alkaline phosphatase D family protein n=1 Tax=Henriciella sp. AS95 TaxID=3135782 RepID=UPI003180167C
MKVQALVAVGALSLASCATQDGGSVFPNLFEPAPTSAVEALNRYYEDFPESQLPKAPEGLPLPASDAVISRVLVASCNDEELESPTLARLAEEDADLFLMIGDNVYGDRDGRNYAINDVELTELRESFSDLKDRPEFQAVRAKFPMMVAWDDHDMGQNDGGKDFPFKALAERVHETFWGLTDEDVGQWPGTYYARAFGPEGKRVQVIVLDTRFFRSELTPTDEYGAVGKERYMPPPAGAYQDMLGSAQWTWLQNQLQAPADIRLVVSSIQVMPTTHGWEAWSTMPEERQRLFDMIKKTGADGVVFLSGDRHTGFIYEERGVLPYAANELTASSLNVSFATETSERDTRQIGAGFPPENYGAVEIDWDAKKISLVLKDTNGQTARRNDIAFSEIGVD